MSKEGNDQEGIHPPYPLFKSSKIYWTECICLCYHGDKIDARAQSLHDFNVQRLEGVASRSDEVEASMHSEVYLVNSARLLFL